MDTSATSLTEKQAKHGKSGASRFSRTFRHQLMTAIGTNRFTFKEVVEVAWEEAWPFHSADQ